MSLNPILERLGSHAKDIKLNLRSVLGDDPHSQLSAEQVLGVALASAYTTRNRELVQAFEDLAASDDLSDAHREAAKIASTLMAMNNVYYRAMHFASDESYMSLPPGLRMLTMQQHGIEQKDFELYALAVSAINGCGFCVDAHIKQLENHGLSQYDIQRAIRVSAVVSAAAQGIEL